MAQFFSPAKINLFLRVISKQPNGYHHLSSLFQTISLGDTFNISLHDDDMFSCNNESVPLGATNLIAKAVALFRRNTGFRQAFKIHLIKRIPMQAGLGGGSSNAATTLWACNQLANTCIPNSTLQEWSAELGSDVPFFFSDGTAHCTGRGEQVHPLSTLPQRSLWIVKPHYGLATMKVFQYLDFKEGLSDQLVSLDLENCLRGNFSYFNMLEKPAFEIRPELSLLRERLFKSGFKVVMMTGSGSALICFGEEKPPEQECEYSIFPAHYIRRLCGGWYAEEKFASDYRT